jgi:predicted GIY-YIG superfamily endonuclease
MVTLYVLKGETGRRYVGITNNLSRRLQEHRARSSKGGQTLGKFYILHTEYFPDHKSARKQEKFLNQGKAESGSMILKKSVRPAKGG